MAKGPAGALSAGQAGPLPGVIRQSDRGVPKDAIDIFGAPAFNEINYKEAFLLMDESARLA